jgi:hypothetical protein
MAELTQQDIDNFDKLKEALTNLKVNSNSSKDPIITTIKQRIPATIKKTEELSEIVNPLYSYWQVLSAVGTPIQFNETPPESKKFEQKFSDAIENLKRSLKVVEADKVDLTGEIEEFQPDSLFLDFIKDAFPKDTNPQKWTETLIVNGNLNLAEEQINQLIQAWGIGVNLFVDDARKKNEKKDAKDGKDGKVTPLQPETFAHFFRIHKELEVLYSRLADTNTAQKIR